MNIQLDMIGLVTSNMAEAIRFYRLLGLPFPEPDGPYVEATTPSGLRVSLNDLEMMKGIDPGWIEPAGQRISMAFLCDDAAGVDATYERMISEGFVGHMAPFDAFWGQRYAVVDDPDGNHVDLFAPLS
ncbi:MAG: VOC family protein [Fimbriimonas sp.]